MAAWGRSREERERAYHRAMAELDAAHVEDEGDGGDGPVRYAVRSVVEDALLLLGGAVVCALGAVLGLLVGGSIGLVVGFVAGLVVCGVIGVVGGVYGALAWRREVRRRP